MSEPTTFIDAKGVAELMGLTASGLRSRRARLETLGFPPPVPWSLRPLKWRRADVEAWVDGLATVPAAIFDAAPSSGDTARRVVMLHRARQS